MSNAKKVRMTSRFEGFTVCFLKALLKDNTAMEEKQATILKGKRAKHPLHLTLTVLNIASETQYTEYLTGSDFAEDLERLVELPTRMDVSNPTFLSMGTTAMCFAITLEAGEAFALLVRDIRLRLCDFLCEKLNLVCEEDIIEGKYPYKVLKKEGIEVLRMPNSDSTPLCHVTLFTSFDLKRCNKPLFKRYADVEGGFPLLCIECGPVTDLVRENIGLSPLLVITH